MKTRTLLQNLGHYYPARLREPGDYGGLMEGKLPDETKRIFVCLDFDDQIADLAVRSRPDLILTHHPFIFGKKQQVLQNDPVKKSLYERMDKIGIPIYSMHTNFDTGTPGMNDALAEKLSLNNVKALIGDAMARGGELSTPMEVHSFSRFAKSRLEVPYGLLIAEGKPLISKVAIIGGGGWQSYAVAQQEGYDIFISGDCPHHGRREIVLNHFNYLDLPHEIELIFIDRMTKTLLNINQELIISSVRHEKCPEVI